MRPMVRSGSSPSLSRAPCQLTLVKQTSKGGTCRTHFGGLDYGCQGTVSSAHVWVRSGCRGIFDCNGARVSCGNTRRCQCQPPSWPPPPPPPSPLPPPMPLRGQALALYTKIHSYLARVYPNTVLPHDLPGLQQMFDSLDLLYPHKVGKAYLRRQCAIPYVPRGAFFVAPQEIPSRCDRKWATGAQFDRHPNPVTLMHRPWRGCFVSGITGRYGPQPSWTPHTTLTRYIFYPAGFCANSTKKAALNDSCAEFDLSGSYHVMSLFSLREGDWIEVTQYGGWLTPNQGRLKGFWANIWRGSGIFIRAGALLVSMCKMNSIIDMVETLYQRDSLAIDDLTGALNATGAVQRLRRVFVTASSAEALLFHCLMQCPCMHTQAWAQAPPPGFPALMARWFDFISKLPPRDAVLAFRSLTHPSRNVPFSAGERFAIYWTYSFCGAGTLIHGRQEIGVDFLIALLACMLRRQTVAFAANPNDNGFLHQEMVDFEFSIDFANLSVTSSMHTCWNAVQYEKPADVVGETPRTFSGVDDFKKSSQNESAYSLQVNATGDTKHESMGQSSDATPLRNSLWHAAVTYNKFASSRNGSYCRAVFGKGLRSFDTTACDNKLGACYLWCDCVNNPLEKGTSSTNQSTCSRAASAAFRTLLLQPEELQCPPKTEIRRALQKGLTWPLKLLQS